jgi:uncharacterized protein YbjT (DUF2867 family)
MRIAITGGEGFLGRNAAALLERRGDQVVRISRRSGIDVGDSQALRAAFSGCDAVIHAAGINRERGAQTYHRVHRQGTANVVRAALDAGVGRLVFLSFLRARPNCGSSYHESKWDAEEAVRASGLDYTILRPGIVFGPGDHMLDHLSRALQTFPVFALMGRGDIPMRPVAIDDLALVITAACTDPRLSRRTVPVVGPEEITLRIAAQRVANTHGRRARFVPLPIWVHRALAALFEWTMVVPLAARAQVRILSESLSEPLPAYDPLPEDLRPRVPLDEPRIRTAQPAPTPLRFSDLRLCARATTDRIL